MRISFAHDPCGKASVCAQLIKDTKGEFTFRKWNPNRKEVPYYVPTDQMKELWESVTCAWIVCFFPICINHCCREEGQGTIEKYMDGE